MKKFFPDETQQYFLFSTWNSATQSL